MSSLPASWSWNGTAESSLSRDQTASISLARCLGPAKEVANFVLGGLVPWYEWSPVLLVRRIELEDGRLRQ